MNEVFNKHVIKSLILPSLLFGPGVDTQKNGVYTSFEEALLNSDNVIVLKIVGQGINEIPVQEQYQQNP